MKTQILTISFLIFIISLLLINKKFSYKGNKQSVQNTIALTSGEKQAIHPENK